MVTVISVAVVCAALAADAKAEEETEPVRHVVLFKFKEGTTPEQLKPVEEGLDALPEKIDLIEGFEWGTNVSPEGLSDGYSHALVSSFASRADLEAYGPHPEHEAFRQVLAPVRDRVTVVDYVPRVVVAAPEKRPGQVRHVVLFQFKDSATPEQVEGIEKAFVELPEKIDTIQGFEWGTSVGPEDRTDGFTHCFVLTFADEAGRDAYLPHPAHKEFGKALGPYVERVRVVDFEVRK